MIYDITREICEDMPVYKNKESKKPRIEDLSRGEVAESKFHLESHTGTHIDAPLHMIKGGSTVLEIEPSRFISPAQVIDLSYIDEKLTRDELEGKVKGGHFILLKTKNSKELGLDFVYLERSGAEYLAEQGITGVGIDALGIERDQPGHETHKILFKKDILILEGLDLSGVPEGHYKLFFAPLKIDADASPVRAILIGD